MQQKARKWRFSLYLFLEAVICTTEVGSPSKSKEWHLCFLGVGGKFAIDSEPELNLWETDLDLWDVLLWGFKYQSPQQILLNFTIKNGGTFFSASLILTRSCCLYKAHWTHKYGTGVLEQEKRNESKQLTIWRWWATKRLGKNHNIQFCIQSRRAAGWAETGAGSRVRQGRRQAAAAAESGAAAPCPGGTRWGLLHPRGSGGQRDLPADRPIARPRRAEPCALPFLPPPTLDLLRGVGSG